MPSMRMRAALLGVLLAVSGLPRGPVLADVAPSVIIVPGESIGPVRLGMSTKSVTSVLGNPVPADGGQVRFPRVAVTVTLEEDAVVQVSTTNPQFRTARGARVGIGLDDSSRLVGDSNQTQFVDGNDTTVLYPFQGIGFVFRGGRAVEVFVVPSIALSPSLPPPLLAAPPAPLYGEDAQTAPPLPQLPPSAQAAPAQSAAPGEGSLTVPYLTEMVDAGGTLRISGTLLNTSQQPVGPLAVSARFARASGGGGGEATSALTPLITLSPGQEMPFTLEGSVARSVIVQYAVEVVVGGATSASRFVVAQHTVSRDAYADLARLWVRVSAQLGGPSNVGPNVQVLVSIAGTGPMPPDWVRAVEVDIPFTGGSNSVTLTPGQTQTILIPAVAQLGEPQVRRVVINGS